MNRGRFFVVTGMVTVALAAGALVATLVPGVSTANAAVDLKLAPPSTAPAVVVPSFADLAERAIPSVVGITASKIESAKDPHEQFFDNPFFRRFFRGETFGDDQNNNAQPKNRRQKRQWGGSGFFITSDGYILTNKHVIEDAETVFVRTSSMTQLEDGIPAKVVGQDPYLDVALIKIEGKNDWPALPLGDSDKLRVGEWSIAIGNPIVFRNSVTTGVISGKGRRLAEGDPSSLGDYIQTDAAINFGNSGGPLLNAKGEVIGINTAIIRDDPTEAMSGRGGYVQGIGFALPISAVKRVLSQIASTGTVKRGYLGVSVTPLSSDAAEFLKVPGGRGAYVARVEKDGPASKAGLAKDDVILTVDDQPVATSEELVSEISSHHPGEKVKLGIWRDGKKSDITVTLAERTVGIEKEEPAKSESAPEPEGGSATALGFTVGPLTPQLRERLKEMDPPVKGVLITDVDPASEAANKGVGEGMIVMDLNGRPTPSVDAYRKAASDVKPGQVVRVRILDGRGDEATVFFRAPKK